MGVRRQRGQDCSLRRSRPGGTPAQAAPWPTGAVPRALEEREGLRVAAGSGVAKHELSWTTSRAQLETDRLGTGAALTWLRAGPGSVVPGGKGVLVEGSLGNDMSRSLHTPSPCSKL